MIKEQFKDLIKKDLSELSELKVKNEISKQNIFDTDLSKQEKQAAIIYGLLIDTAITFKETNSNIKDALHYLKSEVNFILNMNI